jgi:branched-chain amino acid transport system ATP-binding protein
MVTGMMMRVSNLDVRYDRLIAIRNVSFDVPANSIVAIIGPNGAGKSTMLKAIAGGLKPHRGTIEFAQKSIVGLRPEAIARLGIALVPEGRHVFGSLTVEENLRIGSFMLNDREGSAEDMQRVLDLFPRLRQRFRQSAGQLSGGEQQMLVLARALMTRPKLLMIDEPSLGLAPRIVDEVYAIFLALRETQGLTLLINEQTSKRVLKFADTIHVMRDGAIHLSDASSSLRDSGRLSEAYFGHVETSRMKAKVGR